MFDRNWKWGLVCRLSLVNSSKKWGCILLVCLDEVLNSLNYCFKRVVIFIRNFTHFAHKLHVINFSSLIFIQKFDKSIQILLFNSLNNFLKSNLQPFRLNSSIIKRVSFLQSLNQFIFFVRMNFWVNLPKYPYSVINSFKLLST